MEKIKVNVATNYGGQAENAAKGIVAADGFNIAASCELDSPAVIKALAEYGLTSLLYRGGASLLNDTFGKKGNSEVVFSDENALKLTEVLTAWFKRGCPNKKGSSQSLPDSLALSVSVSRRVLGTVADSKFTEEIEIASRHESAGDLDEWLIGVVEFAGDSHDEAGEFSPEMLRAVRAYKIRRLAELKRGI